MDEQIKNRLYESFSWSLRENIVYDEFFHVDVELKSKGSTYFLTTTLYAEGGTELYTDYDQPREFENPCISCHFWNLVCIKEDDDPVHYDDEAEEIILMAINNYRV